MLLSIVVVPVCARGPRHAGGALSGSGVGRGTSEGRPIKRDPARRCEAPMGDRVQDVDKLADGE